MIIDTLCELPVQRHREKRRHGRIHAISVRLVEKGGACPDDMDQRQVRRVAFLERARSATASRRRPGIAAGSLYWFCKRHQ
jgi:hypothetical protein